MGARLVGLSDRLHAEDGVQFASECLRSPDRRQRAFVISPIIAFQVSIMLPARRVSLPDDAVAVLRVRFSRDVSANPQPTVLSA